MTVRAKFAVSRIERSVWSADREVQTITLNPVMRNENPESENSKFFQATPGGQIQLSCVNSETAAAFVLGAEYYVDFTAVEPA